MAASNQSPRPASEPESRSLREIRAERLLSLRDLARLAGVALSTVYLIEVGRSTPRRSAIRRLSEALGVDPLDVTELRRALRAHADAG